MTSGKGSSAGLASEGPWYRLSRPDNRTAGEGRALTFSCDVVHAESLTAQVGGSFGVSGRRLAPRTVTISCLSGSERITLRKLSFETCPLDPAAPPSTSSELLSDDPARWQPPIRKTIRQGPLPGRTT